MKVERREPGAAGLALRALYVTAGAGVALAVALRRTVARGEDAERLRQRMGRWPRRRTVEPWVWIHASSVGEADLGVALAQALAGKLPGLEVVVSSNTATGRARVAARELVESRYFPIDFAPFIRRIVDGDAPLLFVAVETEIWPEAWRVLQDAGVPVAVANARLSDRSLPRYRRLSPLLGPVLARTARICARDAESARRWLAIGAPEAAVEITGNLKFDLGIEGQVRVAKALFERQCARPLLLAASTHEGEEAVALDAFLRVRAKAQGCVLLLAPRHPPRAAGVVDLARKRRLRTTRWSELGDDGAGPARDWPPGTDVVVLDRLGLLDRAYRAASAAFVGGSLVAGPGGHNLLEPVTAGCAVASGPLLGNVEDQAGLLREVGALDEVVDVDSLSRFWLQVVANPSGSDRRVAAAADLLRLRAGALDRTVRALAALLDRAAGDRR